MKKLLLLVSSIGLGVFASLLSVNAVPASGRAAANFPPQAAQQSVTTAASGQQQPRPEPTQLLLAGKVLVRHGHYVFYNTDTHSTFRIANPAKAKPFKGDTVRIQGKINAKSHMIYIYKINSFI